jgi:uncharacterized membrane protein
LTLDCSPTLGSIRVKGEAWQVHGGGFYHIQKFAVAPEFMPEHLTWFKWEAYGTWFFGFTLLVLVYYLNPTRMAISGFILLCATTYGYTHVFSGRGAFIQVGALVRTIMEAIVLIVVIPGQRGPACRRGVQSGLGSDCQAAVDP